MHSVSLDKQQVSQTRTRQISDKKNPRKVYVGKVVPRDGRYRDDERYKPLICPGCGIPMQDKTPHLPGFYQKSDKKDSEVVQEGEEVLGEEEGLLVDEFGEGEEVPADGIGGKVGESDGKKRDSEEGNKIDWDARFEDDESSDLDVMGPLVAGYGNITEETIAKEEEMRRLRRISKAERKRMAREAARVRENITVCARCHSLRNYGQVKNQFAENLMPDFDFDRLIATQILKPSRNVGNTVVVMVVDCVDFDGSFPKRASKSLFKALEGTRDYMRSSKKLPKVVLVATKVDLLPSQISPTRLDRWVRHRARAAGAPKLTRVYLVSAHKDLGVRNLLSYVKELAGPRGNVWIIGAQNAGKSTLINVFAKKEGLKATKLTEAAVPGTTLGILTVGGILPAKAKLYDTPGLLHPYLLSILLNREEQKMIEMRKELQPRTYRMKEGQTVHVGGLMRLDVNQASVQTIYVTVWVSPNVSLHMGKTENSDEIFEKHAGVRLQPPICASRVSEMGKWEKREIVVSGNNWDVNSTDIAVAGLGWFSLGLKGEATVALWTYSGVQIMVREPLVLDRAPLLERPGFLLPKAISEAMGKQTKLEAKERKRLREESSAEVFA